MCRMREIQEYLVLQTVFGCLISKTSIVQTENVRQVSGSTENMFSVAGVTTKWALAQTIDKLIMSRQSFTLTVQHNCLT